MAFKSGESGNKNGRPKGSGYRQQLFNKLVEPRKEELFEKGINLALEGNDAMLRLFLERMLPSKTCDDAVSIEVPADLKRAEWLLEAGENVLKALSQGTLTPQQANQVMSTIESQRKNIETSEIAERLIAVERTLKQRK